MKRSLKLRTLPLLLLTLSCATLCFASDYLHETCQFDKYMKANDELALVEELPANPRSSWTAYTATATESWEPIRILVSTEDLHDATKYCNKDGQKVKDFLNGERTCEAHHIFNEKQGQDIKRTLRSAVQMHAARLKVKHSKHGFKVPTLTGDFCSSFTVPQTHKEGGVLNADMVLYVAPLYSSTVSTKAIAAPCAALKDGRPVVGGIALKSYDFSATPYDTRIVAHQIAHALGFSYNVMSTNSGVKLTTKKDVRQKPHVTEVTGAHTVNAVKQHFKCPTATGMELEDEMGYLKAVSHSHWERRNAREDLMAPVISSGRYSALTLALFNDLGYYQAEMDEAEAMSWSAGAGCAFLETPCVTNGQTAFPKYFCAGAEKENQICDDGREIVRCSRSDTSEDYTVPTYFDYFADNKVNYESSFVDNCPTWVRDHHARCLYNEHDTLPGYKSANALCFTKALGSKNIKNDEKFKGICAKVEILTNKDVEIEYEHDNKVTCTNGKATLGGNYDGVVVECPTGEELINKEKMDNLILLSESEMDKNKAEYVIKATHKQRQPQPSDKSKAPPISKDNQPASATPSKGNTTTEKMTGESVTRKGESTEKISSTKSPQKDNGLDKNEQATNASGELDSENEKTTVTEVSPHTKGLEQKKGDSATHLMLLPFYIVLAAITAHVITH